MASSEDLRRRSELLWDDGALKGSRGPRAGLTRGDLVQAAMKIADKKGLSAVTMHAVAAKLGFTTMALYRYFPNKQALIDAITDAAYGQPPAAPASGGWREAVRHWAFAKRTMLCARPWLAELPFVAAPHGPNWLSWHEAFLATILELRLNPDDMLDMLSIVDGYVRGNSDTAISLARAQARGVSFEEWAIAVGRDLARAINDARYPILSSILTSQVGGISPDSPLPKREGKPRGLDEAFFFGLDRVLDGLERYVTARN